MSEDASIITALGHPLRAQILTVLDTQEASPKELSALLGEKLGNVSYHVRILRELGLIELQRTTPRRGAVEHHYRSSPRDQATLNVECDLNKSGWGQVSEALTELQRRLERIAKKNHGDQHGRVVAAVLFEQ